MNKPIKIIDKTIYLKFLNLIGKDEITFILNYVREYFDEKMPIVLIEKPFTKNHLFCHRYQNFEVALYSKYIVLYIYTEKNEKFIPKTDFLNNKHLLN